MVVKCNTNAAHLEFGSALASFEDGEKASPSEIFNNLCVAFLSPPTLPPALLGRERARLLYTLILCSLIIHARALPEIFAFRV